MGKNSGEAPKVKSISLLSVINNKKEGVCMKRIFIVLLTVIILASVSGCAGADAKQQATAAFSEERDRLETEINTLTELVDECQALVDSDKEPYDPETKSALESLTTKTRASIKELPELPTKTDEIISVTKELEKLSYKSATEELTECKESFEESVKIMEQITNPSEAFVISILEKIDGIQSYAAATEDNDPNGQLHKAGGYTSAVYFEYDKVNQTDVSGTNLIEKGTDAGGQIEVYETSENAEKRSDYLGTFDGTAFASGSHTVLGTIVIRTSNELTATEQKELEDAIVREFTTLQ